MSSNVFRAVVLSIVLTLAVGPNASLLCAVWCHPDAASAGQCEHPNATNTPRLGTDDSCPAIAAGSTAFVREDMRRGVSASQAQNAVVVPPFQFTLPLRHAPSTREAAQSPPLETRPLVTLRV